MEIITALERIKPHRQTPPSDDNIRRLHYNASGEGVVSWKTSGSFKLSEWEILSRLLAPLDLFSWSLNVSRLLIESTTIDTSDGQNYGKCSSEAQSTRALDSTYPEVRATAEGEGRHFRWGLWNTEISSRLPSLQVLLSIFSRKGWRKSGQKSSTSPPLTEQSPPPPSHYPTCTPPIHSYHLYMSPNSLFYICSFFRPVVAYFLPL